MHGAWVWSVHTNEECSQSSVLFRRTRSRNVVGLIREPEQWPGYRTPQRLKKRQLVQHLRY